MARIGAMLSPMVMMAFNEGSLMPVFIYGGVSLLAGMGSFWIYPETKELKLPDSLGKCEKMARFSSASSETSLLLGQLENN